jgi:uncharacterized membrane protein
LACRSRTRLLAPGHSLDIWNTPPRGSRCHPSHSGATCSGGRDDAGPWLYCRVQCSGPYCIIETYARGSQQDGRTLLRQTLRNAMGDSPTKHEQAKAQRQECVAAILSSPSRHKIVVAGPGTGKTHLFKEMLRGKTNTLTLTFVNSLVEDLSIRMSFSELLSSSKRRLTRSHRISRWSLMNFRISTN